MDIYRDMAAAAKDPKAMVIGKGANTVPRV